MWYFIFIDSRGRDVLKRSVEKLDKRRNILNPKQLSCNRDIIFCCVFTEKPSITTHPQGGTVKEGDNVTLSCNATRNPVPTISWTRDGSPVDTSGRISFTADKKQLTITNVSRTDSGEYRCVARNRVGNDTSNAADLVVQCKTSIFENINVILTL